MTTPLDRIRQVATAMPEVEERGGDDGAAFAVAGRVFATVSGDTLRLTGDDDGVVDLTGDPDWSAIEDRVAHAWELAAPDGLLEAGGR